jgi:hypothetical protein
MRKQVYMQKTVRYSEAFKLQVLRELETGRWESREAAARAYGLSGHATITYWARKYGAFTGKGDTSGNGERNQRGQGVAPEAWHSPRPADTPWARTNASRFGGAFAKTTADLPIGGSS